MNLCVTEKDRQDLINYLVYLEGLASIERCNSLQSDMITDLFAYRFFIAVNNPIVQQIELLPYANYYRGCYHLSKKWTRKWKNKREIPFVGAAKMKGVPINLDYTLYNKDNVKLEDGKLQQDLEKTSMILLEEASAEETMKKTVKQ